MDDPWGSPWASSDLTSKRDPPAPSPPKNLLIPPPKAFFSSTSSLQTLSPWVDDGFKDWKGDDQPDITTKPLDWGVWADSSSQISHPSPRLNDSGRRSPLAWPSSAATSPGLRPLPRSRSPSVFLPHSPDPWAAEVSLQDRKNDLSTISNIPESPIASAQREPIEKPLRVAQDKPTPKARRNGAQLKKRENIINKQASELEPTPLSPNADGPYISDTNPAPKADIHNTPSRSSSTFSVDSTNGPDVQDSPITSIDEDPKLRLQVASRRPSGKVQELVGIYNGIDKATTEEPHPPTRLEPSRNQSRGRSPSQVRSTRGEDDGDFGDFEDVHSEYNKPTSEIGPPASRGRPSTPRTQLHDTSLPGHLNELTESPAVVSRLASIPVQQLIEKFGPIKFDIDFQSIDKLFSDIPPDAGGNTREAHELSDRVIADSFTTISERKTWYRISRYGSMRKHDSGDDDNYHRVEWSTSRLHGDTIKIVRRWMEEDSISGRISLGAGKRVSAFNWDSSAAPIDLGKVFARKASAAHSRNTSVQSPTQSSARSIQSVDSTPEPRRSIQSPIKPPGAISSPRENSFPSFGWSSDAKRSSSIPPPILGNNNKDSQHVKSASLTSLASTKTGSSTHVPAPIRPHHQLSQVEPALEDDDDDDWGEMVSSPRVETHPAPILAPKPSIDAGSVWASFVNNKPIPDGKKPVISHGSSMSMPKLSVSIPQSTQASKQGASQSSSSSAKALRINPPWPLADFSNFQGSPASTPQSPRKDPWPPAGFSGFGSPLSGPTLSQANTLKTQTMAIPTSLEIPIVQSDEEKIRGTEVPVKGILSPIQKSDDEQDQDDVVNSIVRNLPDLSYMLR
ncbi:uncharacterized protein GGS25DRAFT_491607 [Hypoxylon fragiforme]|uniref:uncharacterized protein n=1 Tax=Hypoxylon fragiforme TaxID=63214 RepID=UPI0020C5D4E8|nr:uncharacterized protein GGS25DRAFT_491607 [Hypoxylon fragiforme]KAI2608800.1 hypothetical protein GGS25DRAFT_491607 [Hypoxylon fragiforme]